MAGVELGGTFGDSFGTRVVIDPAALAELLRGPAGPVFRQLTRAGDVVKEGARRRVGVWKPQPGEPGWSVARRVGQRSPGTLRDSIVKRVVQGGSDGFTIVVGSEDRIALWHHEGTKPHPIVPTTKPLLVFYTQRSGVVRVQRVNHPGTRPNRFLTDSLADLRGMF